MTLSTVEKVLYLKGAELFGDVSGEELVPVARIAHEVSVQAGERLIGQGEIGDSLYIIVDGEVRIVTEEVGEVARRKAGDVIGEMGIVSRRPRTADCIALTDVTALKVVQDDFWDLIDEYPKLAHGTIAVLAKRVDELIEDRRRRAARLG